MRKNSESKGFTESEKNSAQMKKDAPNKLKSLIRNQKIEAGYKNSDREITHDKVEELVDFLRAHQAEYAVETIDLILNALTILEQHPEIGRLVQHHFRELIISRGKKGYVALYEYDQKSDVVLVLAIRHQREAGYH
jgi:plasmid stabilization system protein ParE